MHRADRVGGRVDGDLDRVLHVAAHEVADVAVERGREQHRLARRGALAQDPLDLRGEPVVGHAVGLVEHDDLDRVEVELVLLQQVDQAQRRGDDDVDAALAARRSAGCATRRRRRRARVRSHRRATGSSTSATCSASSRVGTSTSASGRRGSALPDEAGQHRHAEGQRLARAGAGPAADVAARERDGDRLGLDGERRGEAGGGEAASTFSGTPRSAKPVGTYVGVESASFGGGERCWLLVGRAASGGGESAAVPAGGVSDQSCRRTGYRRRPSLPGHRTRGRRPVRRAGACRIGNDADMKVALTVNDFLRRAEQLYPDRIGVVDEPDQPAESWGSITYARDGRAGPGAGRGARRPRHRRRRAGRDRQPQLGSAADRAVRRQRLGPGARADQLPARRRRGQVHRRAQRRPRAAGRPRARRGAGVGASASTGSSSAPTPTRRSSTPSRSRGRTTRTPPPPSTTPAAPRPGRRACS